MLKKAGIIVAVATAGVLAVSSFAFADTKKDNVNNHCTFGNSSGSATDTQNGGSGGLLGGVVATLTGTVTNGATQANTGNCTNAVTSNAAVTDSNNSTKTRTVTKVKHSYND